MKTYIIALSLFSSFTFAGEYETSIGLGHQYGGVVGGQLAYKTSSTKYYASLGLIGGAVGFQTTFNEDSKHAYGIVIGSAAFQSEDGFVFATYNYHVNGFNKNGLVIGTGFGVTRQDEGGSFGDIGNIETSPSVTLNIGYKF